MNQKIADLIQRRRLQLLVHSRIYYELNRNIISDKKWDEWARELVELQRDYPEESKRTIWYEAFKDWDASTGAFLPLNDEWVVQKANYILRICGTVSEDTKPVKNPVKKKISKKKGLF